MLRSAEFLRAPAVSRRVFLGSVCAAALIGPAVASRGVIAQRTSLPLGDIILRPSIFKTAIEANRRVLFDLQPDRLLHNFRWSAGLEPRAPVYGGWEKRGIAGHSLGHYLSALSMLAARGDKEARDRAVYIVSELAACQNSHGDGYVGGTTVKRDGEEVDGKIVFEEIRKGDIRTSGFDINGGWVPLYTWHKVQAGLIDAVRLAGIDAAMPVLIGMSTYLADVLDQLDHTQMQKLLAAEHGGLNESYADLYAMTGEDRWLRLAKRIRHEAVLDPLARGENNLPGLHANTQIPKVIGLARLHELTGEPQYAQTASFFYRTVLDHHTYAIGGNSEREHFAQPSVIAGALTDRTCEACNSYNMMKLTRYLWSREPDAAYFDEYERTYLNHIVAHQHPETGMFVYFMPLRSGSKRTYSTLEDSFWCCVGSGMESHAKHGDSAFWQEGGDTLFVNLYMPAAINWREGGMEIALDTEYPRSETVKLTVEKGSRKTKTIALRLPGWSQSPSLTVNGEQLKTDSGPGYARIERRWRRGDVLEARFPMSLAIEPAPDDENTVSFSYGPMVLAANLGVDESREGVLPPAIVSEGDRIDAQPVIGALASFKIAEAAPGALTLSPFFDQYENRTAVYFPRFTKAEWKLREAAFREEQAAQRVLERRTIDVIYLGEMQPERDHNFRTNQSDVIVNGGRSGRTAWWGEGTFIEFDLAVGDGPVILRALYWGNEINKNFKVMVEGEEIARERRQTPSQEAFISVDYPVPARLTRNKDFVAVRFETLGSDAPVYEVRTMRPSDA